ncbi:hypothetical protein C7B61_20760 [filamentous cyanobacterium CCP1]|nr:hypothetical protein C7B76_26260 [filamentous cyanobacterium CCP2]PSB56183.1 hypothetical protein C7B61_20760 [filamentous cyanobacterium CCP1]
MVATTSHSYSYRTTLEASYRVNWRVEDLIGNGKQLDFSRPFLPESLARVQGINCLNEREKLLLNQIRGYTYLHLFEVTEAFILPSVVDHVRQTGMHNMDATQAFLCFAEEESKHTRLFRRFADEFRAGFGTPCEVIGPVQEIADAVLSHSPLGVALVTLQAEWMTQRHYLESVKDNLVIDSLFSSMLKHHWLEEAQHAKLDTLMVEHLASEQDAEGIQQGIDDYFAIGAMIEEGLMAQVQLDIESLERAAERSFNVAERQEIQFAQEGAYRWAFLGSGMSHPHFIRSLGELSQDAVDRLSEMAKSLS